MGTVNRAETAVLEAAALRQGCTEKSLLHLAGCQLGHAIARFFPHPGTAIAYLGKGHNAADTLIALRLLRNSYGWEIFIRPAFGIEYCSALTQQKWREVGAPVLSAAFDSLNCQKTPLLLIDGLLGTGSRGPMRPPIRELVAEMNILRDQRGARIAAVDLPTGLDDDYGSGFETSVQADVTFMIANAKLGLLQAHAASATGALVLVPVEPLTAPLSATQELISPVTLGCGKSPRPFDFHKGQAGRVSILAGSNPYSGAAVLAASGALRGGAGLITLFVPARIRQEVISRCPPEIIVRDIEHPAQLGDYQADALVIGCGLGQMDSKWENELLELIEKSQVPAVIDADALNLIAKHQARSILSDLHVLTPHPGEFARLAPELADLTREQAVRNFTNQVPSTLLLKGSRTLVTQRGAPVWCNSTGTPAMATGGQGDVLAGVIGAQLSSAKPSLHAAALGAWICGRSAEIALLERHLSEESLTPSDVLQSIGAAFKDWKCARR
jgi:ADP-dependent NAD(P)H-hydrate dehydratase / NAD(P)H-hydrate epimerase